MTRTDFINGVTRTFYKGAFFVKKHSPEMLVIGGTIGLVVGAVAACKATLKVDEVTAKAKEDVEKIHEATEKGVTAAGEEYTLEDSKKELAIVYIRTGVEFAKLYAPAIIIGGASIACILAGNNLFKKRNAAIAAAYATIDNSFKEYRSRVIERFGKDLDRELKYDIKAVEVEETVVNEDGSEQTVTRTVHRVDPSTISDYARVYHEGNVGWSKDPEFNLMFLKSQQEYCTKILQTRGYLYLNEVYELLGFPKTAAGQTIGWIYDEKFPMGDNFVDFGIYNIDRERNCAFINGEERNILLEFNVHGNIVDLAY